MSQVTSDTLILFDYTTQPLKNSTWIIFIVISYSILLAALIFMFLGIFKHNSIFWWLMVVFFVIYILCCDRMYKLLPKKEARAKLIMDSIGINLGYYYGGPYEQLSNDDQFSILEHVDKKDCLIPWNEISKVIDYHYKSYSMGLHYRIWSDIYYIQTKKDQYYLPARYFQPKKISDFTSFIESHSIPIETVRGKDSP